MESFETKTAKFLHEDLSVVGKIGQGAQGAIYLVVHNTDKTKPKMVLKIFNPNNMIAYKRELAAY